ncbi:ssDNA-annealing protein [Caulobacter phage Sansa]|uniref:SsDNA-annealing protein n=1 Tax=Caulobacter phage Sansa TaxID=1675600 RepID=A0A0K1LLY9_9CAUD|nr:RecT-like ssDNA annealing protein [Caulobacter phage Sansa]AKU43469.1 ssDNA-annealing protein [Caulobacter phage Sansa]
MTTTKTKTKARPAPMKDPSAAQLPANIPNTGLERKSPAQQQRDRIDAMLQAIEARMADIRPFLQQSRVPEDLFLAGCRRAFIRCPDLVNCTGASFLEAVMDCARVGLLPDGKRAAIVPFKDRNNNTKVATLIIMYQGFLDVIYRAGQVENVHSQVIYEGEDTIEYLDYDLGSNPFVRFRPPLDRDDGRKIVGAFAHAHPTGGGTPWVEMMGAKELKKVAAVNKATNGPGKDWPGEMARKAPLRRLIKFLPQSVELETLLEIDDKSYLPHPEEESGAKAIPDSALFGDDDYTPAQALEHHQDDHLVDHIVGTAVDVEAHEDPHPTEAMERLMRSAPNQQELDAAYQVLRGVDYGWSDLAPEDKARMEMLYEDLSAGWKSRTMTIMVKRKEDSCAPDQWSSIMLNHLDNPKRVDVLNFWKENLPMVEQAVQMRLPGVQAVLNAAHNLQLRGATSMLADFRPSDG